MARFLNCVCLAAALSCACAGPSNRPEVIPEWRKPNPPLWAYVTSSQPQPMSRGRRFFINTRPSLDPPDRVVVLVRNQEIEASEAKDADIPKDGDVTDVIRYGCNPDATTYYQAPRLMSFNGKDRPDSVPPTPQAQTFQQYVEGLKPIESGSVNEQIRAAACFLAGTRLRDITTRSDAVLSARDDATRRVALRDIVVAAGLACERVDELFDRGADSSGSRFWGVACPRGAKYNVEVKSGGRGTSVMSCSEYHSLSNGDCFKRLF